MLNPNSFSRIRRAAVSVIAMLTGGLTAPSIALADSGDLIIGDFGGSSTGMSLGSNRLDANAPGANLDVADFAAAVDYANSLSNLAERGSLFISTGNVGSGNVVLPAGQVLSFDHPMGNPDGQSVLRIEANQDVSVFGDITHNTMTGDALHLAISSDGNIYLDASGSFLLNEGSLSLEAEGSVEINGLVSASGYDIFANGRISTPDITTSGTVNLLQSVPVGSGLAHGIVTGSITTTGQMGNNGIQLYSNAVRVDGSINAGSLDMIHRGNSEGESFVVTGEINLSNGDLGLTIETDGRVEVQGSIQSDNEHATIVTANGGIQLGQVTVGGNMRLLQPNPNGTGPAGGIQTGSITLTGSEGSSALEFETAMPVFIDGDVSAGGLNSQPPDLSVDSDFTITGSVFLNEGTYNSFNIESGGDVEIGGEVTHATYFKIQANGGIKTGDVTSNGVIIFEQPDPTGSGTEGGVTTGALTGATEGVLFNTGMPVTVNGSIHAGSLSAYGPESSSNGVGASVGVGFVVSGDIDVTGSPMSAQTNAAISIDTLGSIQIDGSIVNHSGEGVDLMANGAIRTGDITAGGNLSISQSFPTGTDTDDGIHVGSILLSGNSLGNNSLQISSALSILVDGPITADRVDIGPGNGDGYTGLTINGEVDVGELGEMNISHRGEVIIRGNFTGRQLTVYNDRDESSFESGSIQTTEAVEINVGRSVIISGDLIAADGQVRSNAEADLLGISAGDSDIFVAGDVLASRWVEFKHRSAQIGGSIAVTSNLTANPQYPNRFSSEGSGTFELNGDLTVQRGFISIEHENGISIDGTTTSDNGEIGLTSYLGPIQTGDLTAALGISVQAGTDPVVLGHVNTGGRFMLSGNDVTIGNIIVSIGTTNDPGQIEFITHSGPGSLTTGDMSAREIQLQNYQTLNLGDVYAEDRVKFEVDQGPLHITAGRIEGSTVMFERAQEVTVVADLIKGSEIVFYDAQNVIVTGAIETSSYFNFNTNDGSFSSGSITVPGGIGISAKNVAINGDLSSTGGGSLMLYAAETLEVSGGISFPGSVAEIYGTGRIDLNDLVVFEASLGGGDYFFSAGSVVQANGFQVSADNTRIHMGGNALEASTITISNGQLYVSQMGLAGGTTAFQNNATIHPEGAAPGPTALNILGDVNWYTENGFLKLDMANAAGAAGGGWDALFIDGALTLDAQGGSLTIQLNTFDLIAFGESLNFNPAQNYSWTLIQAAGGIFGYDPDMVQLDLTGFANSLYGDFSLQLDPTETTLNLVYVTAIPEPTTLGLLSIGVLTLQRRRRKTRSLTSR